MGTKKGYSTEKLQQGGEDLKDDSIPDYKHYIHELSIAAFTGLSFLAGKRLMESAVQTLSRFPDAEIASAIFVADIREINMVEGYELHEIKEAMHWLICHRKERKTEGERIQIVHLLTEGKNLEAYGDGTVIEEVMDDNTPPAKLQLTEDEAILKKSALEGGVDLKDNDILRLREIAFCSTINEMTGRFEPTIIAARIFVASQDILGVSNYGLIGAWLAPLVRLYQQAKNTAMIGIPAFIGQDDTDRREIEEETDPLMIMQELDSECKGFFNELKRFCEENGLDLFDFICFAKRHPIDFSIYSRERGILLFVRRAQGAMAELLRIKDEEGKIPELR